MENLIIKAEAYNQLSEEEKIGLIDKYNDSGEFSSGVSVQVDYSVNRFFVIDFVDYIDENDKQFYEKYKLLFQHKKYIWNMDAVVVIEKV